LANNRSVVGADDLELVKLSHCGEKLINVRKRNGTIELRRKELKGKIID
jgi:hypothetical protein